MNTKQESEDDEQLNVVLLGMTQCLSTLAYFRNPGKMHRKQQEARVCQVREGGSTIRADR